MKKELKGQIIEAISAQIKEYPNFYITDIAGLNAGQTSKLRRECFNAGVILSVVKNTLFEKALEACGNDDMKSLIETLVGNTAIMYTTTPAAPGKVIKSLRKQGFPKPEVKGAYVQDCVFIGADKLDQLAAIKTKEELIGDIIGLLQSPMRNILSALENKGEGTPEAKADEAPVAQEEAPAAPAVQEEAPAAPAAEEAATPAE